MAFRNALENEIKVAGFMIFKGLLAAKKEL
jgi:hypothetical protein